MPVALGEGNRAKGYGKAGPVTNSQRMVSLGVLESVSK
jgi:hypothetical protein